MSKLFKLKKWLTIPETEKYLTQLFEEEVTEADILRLALDGELTLSVNLVNGAQARCGKVIDYPWEELLRDIKNDTVRKDFEFMEIPSLHGNEKVFVPDNLRLGKDTYLALEEGVRSIRDIWDLPMIGNERLDVEHRYQMLIGGPEITLEGLDGAFVVKGDVMCQLQDDFDDNQYQRGSKAHGDALEERIQLGQINKVEADALREKYKLQRKEYLEYRKERPAEDNYYPAGGLPDDAAFVVRTESLRKLQDRLTKDDLPDKSEKPLTTRPRNTLLTIINALCEYSNIDIKSRGAAAQIAKLTQELGADISEETILKYLKEIPDAVETRMK